LTEREAVIDNETTLAPVFLVGCPRSGTTLLQRLLDAHPLVAVAPETHFIRRFWLSRDSRGDLANTVNFERVVAEIIAMPEFGDMRLDAGSFRLAARHVPRSYPALFNLLLRSFAQRRGAQVVGEKTPNHLLYMATLEKFFPNARFVHIIRDPRAVVSSWRTVPWSTGTIAGDTKVWRRYLHTAWAQPPRHGALHTIHYEALARDPEKELRGICQFLGLPFERAMLEFHRREPETLDLAREPWKRSASSPVHAHSIEQWQRTLTRTELAEIERLTWSEMRRLGYRPVTRRTSLLIRGGARALRKLTRSMLCPVRRRAAAPPPSAGSS